MQKTKFAGLTVLEANESIYSDNSAFIGRDRFEIDRELKLGVKTHRHDGKEGLSGPIVAPSGLVIGSGGSLPAGRSLTIGVSYEDTDGGETVISPTNLITTPSPIQAPTYQLKTELDYTVGTLSVDTYTYAITLVDASGGETPLGPPVTVSREPGFASATIRLKGLRGGEEFFWGAEGVVAWRLYRARAGGEYFFLKEGETEELSDNGSISPDCDRHPPSFNTNTTGGTSQIRVVIPPVHHPFQSETDIRNVNLYASQSGNFDEDCLVEQLTPASGYTETFISSLAFLAHQPPDVTTSHGGANQINPDTELLDYHWKRPVTNKSELSETEGSEVGDVRMVVNEHKPYILTTGGWEPWALGGGGGGGEGSAAITVFKEGATGGNSLLVNDFFASNDLDERWTIEGGEALPSEFYDSGEAKLVKLGGGAPMTFDEAGEGFDATVLSSFGEEESFACYNVHILRSDGTDSHRILAGYQGGFGHGNPAKIGVWLQDGAEYTLVDESFTEPAVGQYWVESRIKGSKVIVLFYEGSPTSEPLHAVEVDLFESQVDSVPVESSERLMESGKFGLQFVGAPGGQTLSFTAELFEEASPEYIPDVGYIEFREGALLSVGSAHNATGSGVAVTIPNRAGGMGFVKLAGSGEIGNARPTFDGVTWVVTGSGGVPAHMQDGDFLYHENSPGVVKSYIRLGAALAAI